MNHDAMRYAARALQKLSVQELYYVLAREQERRREEARVDRLLALAYSQQPAPLTAVRTTFATTRGPDGGPILIHAPCRGESR